MPPHQIAHTRFVCYHNPGQNCQPKLSCVSASPFLAESPEDGHAPQPHDGWGAKRYLSLTRHWDDPKVCPVRLSTNDFTFLDLLNITTIHKLSKWTTAAETGKPPSACLLWLFSYSSHRETNKLLFISTTLKFEGKEVIPCRGIEYHKRLY